MDHDKNNGWLQVGVSALAAIITFLVLLLVMHWNVILCMILAGAMYPALLMLLRPVERIGNRDVDFIRNGHKLHRKLKEAGEDYIRMKRAVVGITDSELRNSCQELIKTAGSILSYLTENPEKIEDAQKYIDYYQETAANVLENCAVVSRTGLATDETIRILRETKETVGKLNDAFRLQFEKLMTDELTDMGADMELLKVNLEEEYRR